MLRISKQSRLNTDEIITKASGYFGKGGEGLDELNEEAAASHSRGPVGISP